MFYSQTCENIKLIIFTLDGGLLDLNRLRYNYYRSTCETYHKVATREDFSKMLGNMNTMYDHSLLSDYISAKDFNRMVEKDLFEYIKLKPNIKREGVDELIQYCKQKDIKIAVYTTHKTKRAIQYLQLAKIYEKIDFLIGGDSRLKPLPEVDVLEVTCQQMNIDPSHTMVVANFESMVEAANHLLANVIYMPDLVPASDKIKASVYKMTKNHLEIMNMFLFSKYDSVELFSPLLGMNAQMDLETLTHTRNQLLDKYKDDEQLIALVNRTYDYFNEILSKQFLINELEKQETKRFSFDDEQNDNVQEVHDKFNDVVLEQEQEDEILPDEQDDTFLFSKASSLDPQRMSELMDIINGDAVDEKSHEENKTNEENKNNTIEQEHWLNKVIDVVYNLLISVIIVFFALIVQILLQGNSSKLSQIINMIIDGYVGIINFNFGVLFDILHSFISVIPSYKMFVYHNSSLSSMAVIALLAIISNFILITLIKKIVQMLKKD